MDDDQGRFITGAQKGIAQASRGEFIEHSGLVIGLIGCFTREACSMVTGNPWQLRTGRKTGGDSDRAGLIERRDRTGRAREN
jgi:hypothetical protein